MRRCAIVAVCVAALCQQAALGAAGEPQKRLTPADNRLAAAALLKASDLPGGGWKSSRSGGSLPCGLTKRLQPNESGLTETGVATGALFSKGYEALTQTTRVYATPHEADAAWSRTLTKNLVLCMEEQVEGTSSMGAPVSVTDWRRLTLPSSTRHVDGYRVVATAKAGKRSSDVFFDLILIGHARTLTRISISSLQKPIAAAAEVRLVRLASHRLLSPSGR